MALVAPLPHAGTPRPPSRAVSIAISVALVVIWGLLRMVVFETTMFPLTYALPLLVCIWTRDRAALWTMAAIFVVFHVLKVFWILPAGTLSAAETWTNFSATVANIVIAASVVHAVINLRQRLESSLVQIRRQAESLQEQREELAQQNEALTNQAEELARQGEELAGQNEALQSQSDKIGALNTVLERRERLLDTLLDSTRVPGAKRAALEHLSRAALELFGNEGTAVAILEQTLDGLSLQSLAPAPASVATRRTVPTDDLVAIVVLERRVTGLSDLALRPDVAPPAFLGDTAVRSMLVAPVTFGERLFGVVGVYRTVVHDWTDEEFQLAAWLGDQCGRILEILRVQVEVQDSDRRKGEFLATLSHELRNPLTPIRFALDLIEESDGRNVTARRILRRQFQQLVRLVDDLLDATRLASNKIQVRRTRTDFVSVVSHACEAARPDIDSAGHTLTVSVPEAPIWLDADPERLGQVVTNLLNNAARYTPAGGWIRVSVSVSGGEALLSVADSGIGLDAADLDRVFEMFTQVGGVGSAGLGIGLSLVRGIIEQHGGTVTARSDGAGRGAEFSVRLPLAIEAGQAEGAPAAAGTERTSKRVLVVDDNVDAAQMLGSILELHGHQVSIAHDAEGALEAAASFVPDVALLDIGLPGVSGYELARQLRAACRTRSLRLVAVTGWGQDDDRARAHAAGFDLHLTKPAEPADLLAAVGGGDR